MRVKQLWTIVPIPAKIKLLWDRITLTRITTVYFTFSVIHCIIQVIFQIQAYSINVQAINFLSSITEQANTTDPDAFFVLGSDLRLCEQVPTTGGTSSCQVLWDGMPATNNSMVTSGIVQAEGDMVHASVPISSTTVSMAPSITSHISSTVSKASVATSSSTTSHASSSSATKSSAATSSHATSSASVIAAKAMSPSTVTLAPSSTPNVTDKGDSYTAFKRSTLGNIEAVEVNGTVKVTVSGMGWSDETADLDRQCLWALNWPVQILRDTKREDITFIAFQFWLLGMSVVAILNESVPHLLASLLTHMVATGWAGFQIYNTAQFKNDFARLTINGACSPINLLPSYWHSRAAAELPSLVFNATALLTSAFLSWRLAKSFGWQTFKRVGASLMISRVYKLVLLLSIVIQLSLFFMVVAVALWIDQLWNGAIGHLATSPVYKPVLIVTLALLLPWLGLGWFAVRRELRIPMLIFLVLSLAYLVGWGAMFASPTFRWTYMTWTFFGVMTSASVFLTVISFVLGIVCRVNFGKGLVRYLNAQEPLPGEDFVPVTASSFGNDLEKVSFPSNDEPIPTYSAAFGPEFHPAQHLSPQDMTQQTSGPIMLRQPSLRPYAPAIVREPSQRSYATLERQPSKSSVYSSSSYASEGSGESGHSQRWVIE
ncbi:hypothetical protein BJ138DRAFT_201706 [Hygrophoropsis aurantiaca]|uniref:Uncharacterized protein n=1 Tax=Hygrophoropsis aurantiaca TaxID=72124 RepID=A0ACB8AP20_9AGAM|nr:hypothetical protein BJ138DRAFT_201706 [Hygrophoropsis aurantiaca]